MFELFNIFVDCVLLKFDENEVKEIRRNASSLGKFLERWQITFTPEDALIISKGVLSFSLRTIHFNAISTDERPECFLIQVKFCQLFTKFTALPPWL